MVTGTNMAHGFRAAVCFGVLAVAGCGGTGSSPPPRPPHINVSAGGIWRGTDQYGAGSAVLGFVAETGNFYFMEGTTYFTGDGEVYVGTITVDGTSASGQTDAIKFPGYRYPDGATFATGSFGGTVVERVSFDGVAVVQTASARAGTTFTSTFTLKFDQRYKRASSLTTIAGIYGSGTLSLTINDSGVLFAQDATSGCMINGAIATIDTQFNMYDATATFSNCPGLVTGATLTGLATLDNTVSPEQLLIGLSDVISAAKVANWMVVERR